MRRVVEHAALGGEAVLRPQPLDMDERRLTQAIDGVLERGDRDGVVEFGPVRPLLPRVARHNPHLIATR